MDLIITQKTTTTEGPVVTMDCPSCKAVGVAAPTFDVQERNRFFGMIPFFSAHWVTVQCGACKKFFGTSLTCEELGQLTRDEVSALVANWQETNVDFLVKFCIVASLAVGIFPFFGLIFAAIGVLCTYRRKTKWRTAALAGLILSIVTSLLLIVILIITKLKHE